VTKETTKKTANKAKPKTRNRQRRRRLLTFWRMCRYGLNSFVRNKWLTATATAVMTITLAIVFFTLIARQVLNDTITDIRSKVDMSIYVKHDTPQDKVDEIMDDLRELETVKNTSYVTPKEARKAYEQLNKKNPRILKALNESIAEFPGAIRVNLVDINEVAELEEFVKNNETLKEYIDPAREPSFAGTHRTAIQNIGKWVSFAEKGGLVASILFIFISSLIVFNTIRMAIFNRKDEIHMMKLIGAEKSFIRGPFIVEAIVYGFLAAILATAIGILTLQGVKGKLIEYGIQIQPTIDMIFRYLPVLLLAMMLAGATIGVISSYQATRKHLQL